MCNACNAFLSISDMFFSPCTKRSLCLANVAPKTRCFRNFAMSFIKPLCILFLELHLERQRDRLVQGEKNISEILNNVLNASNVTKHAWTYDHVIDFNNAEYEYRLHSDRANQRKAQSIFGAKSLLKQASTPVIGQGPLFSVF